MPPLFRWMCIFIAFFLLASCQSSRKVVPGTVATPDSSALTTIRDGAGDREIFDYLIGPEDLLSIRVFREPDLSLARVAVDTSGRIEMALIGRVDVLGKTPDQLSIEIKERYGLRYLVNPAVTVNVITVNSKRLTVEGAVSKPGVYAFAQKGDLLSAIAIAGGPTEFAKLGEVAVFRKINGENMVAVYDLSRVRSGEMANPDISAGDIVVVGFSGFRRTFQDFLRATPLLAIFQRF